MHAQHIRPHIVARPSVGAPGNVAAIGRPSSIVFTIRAPLAGEGRGPADPRRRPVTRPYALMVASCSRPAMASLGPFRLWPARGAKGAPLRRSAARQSDASTGGGDELDRALGHETEPSVALAR